MTARVVRHDQASRTPRKPKGFDVLCLGEAILDLIGEEPTESLEEVSRFVPQAGGSPANLARYLARVGLRSTFVGKVGDDGAGRLLAKVLHGEGVDTSFARRSRGRPTSIVVLSRSPGTPDFVLHCGADLGFRTSELPLEAIPLSRAVHTTGLALSADPLGQAAMRLIRKASEAGVPVSLDPNWRKKNFGTRKEYLRRLQSVGPRVSCLKASLDDAAALFGKGSPRTQLSRYASLGPPVVVLTAGKEGALVWDEGTVTSVSGRPREIDLATGAGDAFMAVLLAEMLAGRPPVEAARQAAERWFDIRGG